MSDLQMQQSDALRYVGGLWLANRKQEEQLAELRAWGARLEVELTKSLARIKELETPAEDGGG